MFKLIQILLFISLLQSTIYAKTTKDDVDNYIDISRGGEILKDNFKFRYKTYFSKMYGFDMVKADKNILKKYKLFIFNPKYEDIFHQAFSKIDDNIFFEIMSFYKTKLGKKYTQAFRELYDSDVQDELMLLIMEQKDKIIIPEKRKLVKEINKALYSKLERGINKNIFTHGNTKAIEKYKLPTNDENKITSKVIKKLYDEFYAVFSELAYKDFSDDELSEILEYAKTYGNTEMFFLYKALNLIIDVLKKDLDVFLKEKALQDNKTLVLPTKVQATTL